MAFGAGVISDVPTVRFAPVVTVHSRTVALGELADLSALPSALKAQVRGLAVLRAPQAGTQVAIRQDRLVRRLAGLAPALKPWLPAVNGEVRIRYDGPANRPPQEARGCVAVVKAIAAGEAPTSRTFVPAPCTDAKNGGLRFDKTVGVIRAERALGIGDVLRKPAGTLLAGVAPGDPLVLEARVGPVRVQRRVEALQPGRPGGRLFVKAADGAVLSIPYPDEAP